MTYNPDIHHRRSIRLKGYDYSQAGAYFVTVCSWHKECVFGEIVNGEMCLNAYGEIVKKCWNAIHDHFENMVCDEFVVMPNHMHGIIMINCRGEVASPFSGLEGRETLPLQKTTLGKIVAYFKYQAAKQINHIRNTSGQQVWQRNYYETVIRNEKELQSIREYIVNNPMQWELDTEHPQNMLYGVRSQNLT